MNHIEAMKQALEALELCNGAETADGIVVYTDKEITSLRQAIAEAEKQEPVAWVCYGSGEKHDIDFDEDDVNALPLNTMLYTHPQPKREPPDLEFGMNGEKMMFKIGVQQFNLDYEPDTQDEFNFMRDMLVKAFSTFTPDVKPQPKREWVGLTDEEVISLMRQFPDHLTRDVAKAIEAKLKEKNA